MANQKYNDEMRDLQVQDFQRRDEPNFAWKSVAAQYLALPALRAFWPMSSVDYAAASQARDVAGGAYHLTNNNTALFGYNATNQFVPQVDLDGTNQYLSRADGGAANWSDVTGTETYIAQNGLTMGCWVSFDDAPGASIEAIMYKSSAGQQAYRLARRTAGAGGQIIFSVDTGAGFVNLFSTTVPSNDGWYFIVGRFDPSTELAIWINPTTPTADNTLAAGVPANIQDTTAPFTIGATGTPSLYLNGKISMAFLCAAYVDSAIIWQLYQQSREMFNR